MPNKLLHLEEFREVLNNYRISSAGKKILAKTRLVLLVGPTSAGRNTIIRGLLKSGEYHPIISDTTRRPRQNDGVLEKNGREYWFRSEEEVLADLKAGKFLEAAIIHNQQVSGISFRELEQADREGKIAINEIEIVGMQNIIEAKPDSFAYFVVPPSFEEWMKRLDARGNMPRSEKLRRLKTAVSELESALQNDYYVFLVNDNFEHSIERIQQRVIGGRHDPDHQAHGRDVIEKLLVDTQLFLKKL